MESGLNETPADEPVFSSIPTAASIPLPALDSTPLDSLHDDYINYDAELSQPDANRLSKAVAQNVATAGAWELLLPKLVYPLMEQERRRRNPSEAPIAMRCLCVKKEEKVQVVSFSSMYHPL